MPLCGLERSSRAASGAGSSTLAGRSATRPAHSCPPPMHHPGPYRASRVSSSLGRGRDRRSRGRDRGTAAETTTTTTTWQNATGINSINYYSPTVFKSLGITGTSTGLLTTGVFGIIKTIGSFIYIGFLVETVGRRRLLMIGSAGGAFAMYYIAAYIAIAKPGTAGHHAGLGGAGASALVFFYVWTAFYGPTWNPTPWVVNSEMFENANRPIAQTFASASNWLYNFAISQGTPHMFQKMGYGVYLFFASLMVLSIFYIFFLLPETKGIPIEEMDNLFSKRPVWRAHAETMEELRIKAAERTTQNTYGGEIDMLSKRNHADGIHSDSSSANNDNKEEATKIETA